MRLKSLIRKIHLVLSIVASLPLIVLAVTGALLVFPHWLDEVSTGQEFEIEAAGEVLSPSAIVAAMNAALPSEDPAQRIVYPATDGEVITASTKQGRKIVVHPYTGEVLSLSEKGDFDLHRLVVDLHINLLLGKNGQWITGFSAVFLCCLCVTGLYLWWPVGKWNRSYFLIAWQKGWRRLNFDLHRNVGFYAAAVLLLIGLSGTALAFYKQVEPIVFAMTWSQPIPDEPKQIDVPSGKTFISPDDAVAAAQARLPGTRLYRLYLPTKPDSPYRVFLNPPESFNSRHHESRLVVHSYTGEVIFENSPATRSRGDAAMMWVLPLHIGTFGGQPTQWIYLLATLTPVLLSVTGFTLWIVRKRKKWRASKLDSAEPPAGRPTPRRSIATSNGAPEPINTR